LTVTHDEKRVLLGTDSPSGSTAYGAGTAWHYPAPCIFEITPKNFDIGRDIGRFQQRDEYETVSDGDSRAPAPLEFARVLLRGLRFQIGTDVLLIMHHFLLLLR
jgi:hypothetical protein